MLLMLQSSQLISIPLCIYMAFCLSTHQLIEIVVPCQNPFVVVAVYLFHQKLHMITGLSLGGFCGG